MTYITVVGLHNKIIKAFRKNYPNNRLVLAPFAVGARHLENPGSASGYLVQIGNPQNTVTDTLLDLIAIYVLSMRE